MERKLIITKLDEKIITAVIENDTIVELHCTKSNIQGNNPSLGDIFVGKVKKIVANINAAFIEITGGVEGYYAINENPQPIFTHKIGKKPLCVGDELLVQVSKEAVKRKVLTVSSKLNLTGKYCVLTYGDNRVGVSSKIDKDERERLLTTAQPLASEQYGYIIRTNAKDIEEEILVAEMIKLKQEFESLIKIAQTRACFSCLKKEAKPYLNNLKNIYQDGLTEIIIEDKEIYNEVYEYLQNTQPEDLEKLRLYQDSLLPLYKLYNVESCVENALNEHVWLKSGAYLVIQPTEALTVIDVNTGKCIAKKKDDNTYLKINIEAAKEIAKQIRLRNLSGIILIDFINLSSQEAIAHLMESLRFELNKDPITTTLVDVTKLQLVEITRKKVRKPFHEAIRE